MSGKTLKPLQQAVYAALSADAALSALASGVHDFVPEQAAFPYVTFGRMEAIGHDSPGRQREQVRMELEVYARDGGRKRAEEILERLHAVLHMANLSLTGGLELVFLRVESAAAAPESDARTWRGVATLRALVQEA